MNVTVFAIVLVVVIFVGGCFAGHAIQRYHLRLLQSLVPTPEQILGRMAIGPAENFSHGSTTLAGSGSADDHHRPECMICISEFLEGDEIKVLSRCKHGFHAKCIERWLLLDQSSCPTCRTSCKKTTPAERSQQQQQQQQQLNDVVDDIEAAIPSGTEMASTSTATK